MAGLCSCVSSSSPYDLVAHWLPNCDRKKMLVINIFQTEPSDEKGKHEVVIVQQRHFECREDKSSSDQLSFNCHVLLYEPVLGETMSQST